MPLGDPFPDWDDLVEPDEDESWDDEEDPPPEVCEP